jgi:hypothetical protein
MKINEVSYTPHWYIIEAKEGKNVHLTHLEDLVFDRGYAGATQAVQYLNGVRDMLAQGGSKTQKVTVKWDGAPAVIVGVDPQDGKFFVGTKSVFAKSPKLVKDKKSLDEYYKGTPLHEILGYVYQYLKPLGIKGVIQGDLLFSPLRPPEATEIDGESYIVFRPNTITYAVKQDSDLAERISKAKLGVVFHTAYEGDSISNMQSSFGVDVTPYQGNSNVWIEDAYYKDYTGSATLTDQENQSISSAIKSISSQLKKVNQASFDKFLNEPDISEMLNIFMNQQVRGGETLDDPRAFLNDFLEFYKNRQQNEVAKLKGGPDSPAAQKRLSKIDQLNKFVNSNTKTLLIMLEIYRQIIAAKLMLIKKLNTVEGIGTFLKTDTGYKVTNPEGFVAIGHEGGAVKLNDRLEFNRANFTLAKEW